MENNMIELKLPTTTAYIMGNDYGRKVYDDQIRNRVTTTHKNVIVFPDYIEYVSLSFVQGLINELTTEYGREKAFEIIELSSLNEDLDVRLKKAMYF